MEEDIITDLTALQDRLDKMIIRVEQRDLALQQFQVLQTILFTVNSLPEMIDTVLAQAKLFFKLDVANLALLNQDGKITGCLSDASYPYQENNNLLLLDNQNSLEHELTLAPLIGQYDATKQGVFFSYLEQKPACVIVIPLIRHGEYLGSLNLASYKTEQLPDKLILEFVTQVGFAVSVCLENHLNFAIAQQAYRMQALANANNRRFLEQRLVEELDREQRGAHSLSCIMFDVAFPTPKDPSKALQLEAQILQTVAETAKRQLRISDVFSYYEGKRFAAFVVNVPEAIVANIIARLNTAISEQTIHFENQIIPLTLALGYSSEPFKENSTETNHQIALKLIAAAESSLYDAKHRRSSQPKKMTAA